jgi:hypothetical protein
MTFRELEHEGLNKSSADLGGSSLGQWYLGVRDVPLHQLEIGDICRAIRQDLFVEALMPLAEGFLAEDISTGDLYDGELVAALAKLRQDNWVERLVEPASLLRSLKKVASTSQDGQSVRDAVAVIQTIEQHT